MFLSINAASSPSESIRAGAVALGIATALVLTGCAAGPGDDATPGQSSQSDSNQSDSNQNEPTAPEEESTASIPDGWPAAIQVVSGAIVEGANIDDSMFIVTIAVNGDGRAVFDEGVALLERAGHTLVFRLDDDETNLTGQWMGDGYRVNFAVSHTDGVKYADYTVTSAS